jgi:hypothetical protein
LRGAAVDGAVKLVSKDEASRLDGRLDGDALVGTLSLGAKTWDFAAPAAQPPAGLYVYDKDWVRGGWIVDTAGGVTGVLRLSDGSTAPAPRLATDQTTVIDGRTIHRDACARARQCLITPRRSGVGCPVAARQH